MPRAWPQRPQKVPGCTRKAVCATRPSGLSPKRSAGLPSGSALATRPRPRPGTLRTFWERVRRAHKFGFCCSAAYDVVPARAPRRMDRPRGGWLATAKLSKKKLLKNLCAPPPGSRRGGRRSRRPPPAAPWAACSPGPPRGGERPRGEGVGRRAAGEGGRRGPLGSSPKSVSECALRMLSSSGAGDLVTAQ